MSSRGLSDKKMLYELKRFTAGDLKRILNETGFFKVASIISIGEKERSAKYTHEVCIVTENGEQIKINLSFDRSNSVRDGSVYRVAWIEIPRDNMKMQYIIEYNHTGNEKFEGFGGGLALILLGATLYEDGEHVGTIQLANEYITAWKNFSDQTVISLHADKSGYALQMRREGFFKFEPLRNNTDYQELIMYFSKVVHSQSVSTYDFRGINKFISDERIGGAEFENRINYVYIEDGIIKAYTTTECGEAFTVVRDSDAWFYSNGNVIIRNLPFEFSCPIVSNLSISFIDEKTAKSNIGKIDLEHIFTRIAELQKELQEK